MTKISAPKTKAAADLEQLSAGIQNLLGDRTHGRRDAKWLSDVTGIARSTMYRRLDDATTWKVDEVLAVADAFGTDLIGLYRAGAYRPAKAA